MHGRPAPITTRRAGHMPLACTAPHLPMTPEGLLLLAAYYVLGLIPGARVIPWIVDQGWFPVRRRPVAREALERAGVACTGAR